MSRRRDRVQARKQPAALFPDAAPRVAPTIEPLKCPKCGAPVPLGSSEIATCGFCQTQVPLPPEYVALRTSQQQHTADRDAAGALYEKLGKPPGPLLRGWVKFTTTFTGIAGGLLFGLFYVLVSICAVLAFLAGFAIAFLSHAIATLINIDVVERFGGFSTYAGLVVGLVLFVLFPMWLKSYFETTGAIRKTLQANLAARWPEKPGFPSTCRLCGAALDVPKDALGVRCEYCQADNLVAIPHELVRAAADREQAFHSSIVDAYAQASALRRDARKDLPSAAKWAAIVALGFGLLGKGCVALDIDHDLPSYSQSMGPPRKMIPYLDPKQAIPIDRTVPFSGLGTFTVALRHGEVLELTSLENGWCTRTTIHNTTTFPFLIREFNPTWKPQVDRTQAMRFEAPYTGLFQVKIDGIYNTDDTKPPVRWRIAPSSHDGFPPPPAVRIEPAAVPPDPRLTPQAKALADKLDAQVVVNVPARPDLLIATTGSDTVTPALYSIASGEKIFDLVGREDVLVMAADRDGHGLIAASASRISAWSIPDDLEHIKDKLEWFGDLCDVPRATALAFIDARTFAVGDGSGSITVYALHTGQLLYKLPQGPGPVTALAMSADGLSLTATYADVVAKRFVVERAEAWSK